jgi:hypothetical protein
MDSSRRRIDQWQTINRSVVAVIGAGLPVAKVRNAPDHPLQVTTLLPPNNDFFNTIESTLATPRALIAGQHSTQCRSCGLSL